jgi:importin-7
MKGWNPSEEYNNAKPIPDEDKAGLRNRFVPILVNSPPNIRAQLTPALQKILSCDFPQKWPNFIDITIQLLSSNEAHQVYAGVQCLLAVCKVYRFKAGAERADFDKVVEVSFPHLLRIGQGLVNEESTEAAELLHTLLKAYKHAAFVSPATAPADRLWMDADSRSSSCLLICASRMSCSVGVRFSCK